MAMISDWVAIFDVKKMTAIKTKRGNSKLQICGIKPM
jgi:hypothetical protein